MIRKRIAEGLEIPEEALMDLPVITLRGRDRLTIENGRRILIFSDSFLKIGTRTGALSIEGEALELECIKKGYMSLKGRISAIFYERGKQ